MSNRAEIDLRAAINAISDVVQNRPRALREFDQIYMKAGDMVLQSELVAKWADGKRLVFIGDGDSISVCVAYLRKQEILAYGPDKIVVYDFDERICNSILRFAKKESISHLSARLYNALDPFPGPTDFDYFYTNPPWGASNGGESVKVFLQRGMEASAYAGEGLVVVADNPTLDWPKQVLANIQKFTISSGYYVQKMMPRIHSYHLDDSPELRSCNLLIRAIDSSHCDVISHQITDLARTRNFYGEGVGPTVHYVREPRHIDHGKANINEYSLQCWEEDNVKSN